MVSFTPFCSLSFSFDAISGFYTSEGFLSPGLVLAGVIVDEFAEVDDMVDLFIGSCTDYLAAPNRLVVPGVGLVAAAVVGRFNPLFAVELIWVGFLGVVVGVGSFLSKRDVTGLLGVAAEDDVTAEGVDMPKVFLGAGVFGASAYFFFASSNSYLSFVISSFILAILSCTYASTYLDI